MPEIIFPDNLDIKNSETNWWVVHIKPNQGNKISRDLSIENISHFLPLITKTKRTPHGKKTRKVPLFPGYLFFTGDREDRLKVLQTGRTVRIIEVLNQEKLKNELDQVYKAILSGLKIEPNKKFKKGALCRISDGPGLGLTGKVKYSKGNCRVIIEVETIGQSIIVNVDSNQLEIVK